jgi:hypothetical protein
VVWSRKSRFSSEWLVLAAAILTMLGCASSSGSQPRQTPTPSPTPVPSPTPIPTPAPATLFLTPGNWSIRGTSDVAISTGISAAGDVTQSGNNVSGFGATINDPKNCFGPANLEQLTGTMSGSALTLTNSSMNGTITIALTGDAKQLSGTYQITGGCLDLDHGAVSAVFVPSVTGTWKGSLNSTTGTITPITATVTQGPSDPTGFQSYPVSGSVVFTGNACIATGTIDPAVSFVRGIGVAMQNISDRVPPSPRSVNLLTGVTDAPAGTTLSGTYTASGGSCASEQGTVTLVRQ